MVKKIPYYFKTVITGDKSLYFAFDPETKRKSANWVGEISLPPKQMQFWKFKIKIVFLYYHGIVLKEFVPLGSTVNVEFYKIVLDRIYKKIARVRPALWKDQSFFLLHDNALTHTVTIVIQFWIKKKCFQYLATHHIHQI